MNFLETTIGYVLFMDGKSGICEIHQDITGSKYVNRTGHRYRVYIEPGKSVEWVEIADQIR